MTRVTETATRHSPLPQDAQGLLRELQTLTSTGDVADRVCQVAEELTESIERTLTEHRGMVEELLGVYELLGSVFDVTRKLSTCKDEGDVVALFVASLRQSFAGRTVFAVRRNRQGQWLPSVEGIAVSDWFERLLDQALAQGRVIVERPTDAEQFKDAAEVMIGPVMAGTTFVCAIALAREPHAPKFRAVDMALLDSLTTYCGDLVGNHRLVRELRELSITMVRSLVSAVDQKDEYTSGHSLRVGYFATILGKRLGLNSTDLQMVQWSALLHDVGKIGIRDDVLKKAGKLSTEEFDHIKEHPVRSHKVVQQIPQLVNALDGVLHHHERYDGKGYPLGLRGEQIPLQARIIQVADIFDALTSSRSYRDAFSWRKALDILREEAGSVVDPHVQRVFDDLIREILQEDDAAWPQLVARATQFNQLTAIDDADVSSGGSS